MKENEEKVSSTKLSIIFLWYENVQVNENVRIKLSRDEIGD